MTAHTPGPWLYSGGYPAFVAAIDEEDPRNALRASVCELDNRLPEYQRPQSEVDANGWLIAAAPDLLEAAIIGENWLACVPIKDMPQTPTEPRGWGNDYNKIYAAIAKAREGSA